MKKPTDTEEFLQTKRAHKYTIKQNKYHRRSAARSSERIRYRSASLDSLNDPTIGSKMRRKPFNIFIIPSVFSIIDNPAASINIIREVATYSRLPIKIKGISIYHNNVKAIDLAAESVLGLTVREINREIKSRKRKLQITGGYPSESHIKRFIKAVGIVKNLEIKHEYLTQNEEKDLKIFTMRNSKFYQKDNIDQADHKEATVTDFVDHINSCLILNGRELTPEAKSQLCDYTGEIIANAEDHTTDGDWSIVGYLDNSHESHECEITIFNFGNTMASTLKNLAEDHYTKKLISPYVNMHKNKEWFSENWDENDLLTLIALQGDISSKNEDNKMDRGQGTVEMIEFFQKIHKECLNSPQSPAKMAILSGRTHILFDGKYTMSSVDKRKIIAFNEVNSLEKIPDKRYVTNLGNVFFPGTIISIRFPLHDTKTQEAK